MTHGVARGLLVAALLLASLVSVAGAGAASGVSAGALLPQLKVSPPMVTGYSRDLFRLWTDADGNGCDTRKEVLIAEARVRPTLLAGCRLSGGRWWSAYDNLFITDSGGLDIDHFVPLSEAWQSGAWRWSAATREAYANDLGYPLSLIAVTATTNRQKSDQDPAEWMPAFSNYRCTYVATWIAVKWRWRLAIDPAEQVALRLGISGCGTAARVPKPTRAAIATGPSTASAAATQAESPPTAANGKLDPRYPYCTDAIAAGLGPYTKGVDPEYAWYRDGDGDGVVCER
ncbi:MAG: excalibur calcium-binding domain-containing protein [Gaiellales bacterium]